MKLCFLEGCDQVACVMVHNTITTRGQIGDSSCEVSLPFCSIAHAAAFEHIYPTVTERLAIIARFAASFEADSLTLEQLQKVATSLQQIIDVNLGGQDMVIMARDAFEAMNRSHRMLASTQRQLNHLRQAHEKLAQSEAANSG